MIFQVPVVSFAGVCQKVLPNHVFSFWPSQQGYAVLLKDSRLHASVEPKKGRVSIHLDVDSCLFLESLCN